MPARSRSKSPVRSRSKSPARPGNLAPGKHTVKNPNTGRKIALLGETREVLCASYDRGGLRKKDCKTSKVAKAAAKAKKSAK